MRRWYAWLIVALSSTFLIYKYILQVYPSIITNELMRAFHVYGAGLGNLAAAFFYSYLVTQLFVGILLDRFSPRLLSALAIVVAAIGAYLFSQAHTLLLAYISRALMGVGAAFATVSYMKLAANWFEPRQFAFVAGLLATAAMLGAIFGQAPMAWLIASVGWRMSLVYCAVLGFIIASLYVLMVRDKPQQALMTVELASYQLCWADIRDVLSSRQNWLLTFYSGLAFSPVAVLGGLWGNPFLQLAHHINRVQAAELISLIFAGLAIGGPVLGWMSDYLGKRRPLMIFGVLLSLVAVILVIYVHTSLWLTAINLFLFGFGTGAFMLGFAVGKEINKAVLAATVIALINTGDAIFGALTEPLIGRFLDAGWQGKIKAGTHFFNLADYHHALAILPAYFLLAMLLLLFIKADA